MSASSHALFGGKAPDSAGPARQAHTRDPEPFGNVAALSPESLSLRTGRLDYLDPQDPHGLVPATDRAATLTSWSAWPSVNVARAGSTRKLYDNPTLASSSPFTASTPVGFRSTKHTTLYDPPIDEFSVLLTVLEQGETERYDSRRLEGGSIEI
ncbi:hypothetical protein JCM9279_003343 [Rhodotorula babjevae]